MREPRYLLSFGGAEPREVTKAEWVAAERAAGFINTMGRPDEPGTGGFGNGLIRGTIEYPEAVPTPVPCPEGFHWIGQSFAHCDLCDLPAWEHAGHAEPVKGGFRLALRPWEPGEADDIKAKWGPR